MSYKIRNLSFSMSQIALPGNGLFTRLDCKRNFHGNLVEIRLRSYNLVEALFSERLERKESTMEFTRTRSYRVNRCLPKKSCIVTVLFIRWIEISLRSVITRNLEWSHIFFGEHRPEGIEVVLARLQGSDTGPLMYTVYRKLWASALSRKSTIHTYSAATVWLK